MENTNPDRKPISILWDTDCGWLIEEYIDGQYEAQNLPAPWEKNHEVDWDLAQDLADKTGVEIVYTPRNYPGKASTTEKIPVSPVSQQQSPKLEMTDTEKTLLDLIDKVVIFAHKEEVPYEMRYNFILNGQYGDTIKRLAKQVGAPLFFKPPAYKSKEKELANFIAELSILKHAIQTLYGEK